MRFLDSTSNPKISKKTSGDGKGFHMPRAPLSPRHFLLEKSPQFLLKDFWISFKESALWTHPGVASVASQLVAFGSFPDFGKNSKPWWGQGLRGSTHLIFYIRCRGTLPEGVSTITTSFLKKTRLLHKHVSSNPKQLIIPFRSHLQSILK